MPSSAPHHHRRQARAPPGEGPEAKKRMFLGSFVTAVEAAVCFAKHVEQQGGMRGRFIGGEDGEEGEEEEGEEEEGEEEGEEEEEGEKEAEVKEAGEGEEGAGEAEGVRGKHALVTKYDKHKAGSGREMNSLEGLAAAANSFRREVVGSAGAAGLALPTSSAMGGSAGTIASDGSPPDVEEVCRRCGGDTEEDNDLLLCDTPGCGASYHMWCLDTPLASVPEGDWFCPDCDPHEPDMPPPQPMRQPIRKEPQLVVRLRRALSEVPQLTILASRGWGCWL